MSKKLFLLDGMALIYRAFFAFSNNPRITSKGLNTSAMLGYLNTLLEVIKKHQPTHMAVVFDTDAPTDRHVAFEAYKAHREEMPEDLAKSLPYIFRITEGFCIPLLKMDGYEADDIIGTLAVQAKERGFITYIMTPDKDLAQVVDENIYIYKPGRMGSDAEIMGVPEVLKKWEISNVKQVIDILGLWGDAVDGIPGVPGVGEKTAKTLIQKYGSVEGVLSNIHELKGKQKENMEAFREQALLSKQLATVSLNVPVAFDEDAMLMCEPDKAILEPLFQELEFRTIARRVLGEGVNTTGPVPEGVQTDLFGNAVGGTQSIYDVPQEDSITKPALRTIADVPHTYKAIDEAGLEAFITELRQHKEVCFDTETTGIDANYVELVGMSFSWKKGEAYYIPVSDDQLQARNLLRRFDEIWNDASRTWIGQNLKYDQVVLKWYDVTLAGNIFDTMLAHYLIEPEARHGMDLISAHYLNYQPVSIEELIGKKGKNQGTMRDVPLDKITDYAAEDADITLQLKEVFEPQLLEKKVSDVFYKVECPLSHVLTDMEYEGVKIDVNFLQEYSQLLEKDAAACEQRVYDAAGVKFNLASPRQLGEVLFEHLKLDPKAKKTKTGQYATGEEVLLKLASQHGIVKDILDFRELTKLKSTYSDALPKMINPRTGRIHTTFRQAEAVTGRLSSNNPNLQNIPIRTERGREIRKAFVPRDPDYMLLSADYSQIELRIVASMSGDPNMCEAFRLGKDIHTATAARVYGIEESEVTKEMRYKAKSVNFGIIYGQGAFGLAENLGISRTEAKQLIDNYFLQYGAIKAYMDSQVNFAREHGYVETLLGRKRWLRDINSGNFTVRGFAERNAINAPIQGSAADMIKLAMIGIHSEMKKRNLKSRMILQVHDELVFDVFRPELEELRPLIIEQMEKALPLQVPVLAETGIGENWLEAH